MSQATLSSTVSSNATPNFARNDAVTAAPPQCRVYTFAISLTQPVAPSGTKPVSDFISRWSKVNGRAAGLRSARQSIAKMLDLEGSASLRTLRLKAGLSQAELATRMGTSQSHVARLEKGNTDPTLDTMKRLASSVGVDLQDVVLAAIASEQQNA